MFYLSFASYPEAKPFIRRDKMKKDMSARRFELFRSPEAALILTGKGSMEAAAAVSFLLAETSDGESIFCHIRLSDSGGPERIDLCHRILSPDGRVFYPDMLFPHPFEESVEDSPEAAGAFRAASMFFPPHRIFVFHAEARPGSADETAGKILEWLRRLSADAQAGAAVFKAEETDLIGRLCRHLHLTQSMRLELERLARFRKLRGDDLEALLADGADAPCGGAQEGKKAFAELRKKLLDV